MHHSTINLGLSIKRLELEDLDTILAIERASFEHPYSRQMFLREMSLPFAHPLVLCKENRQVGFIDYWHVADQFHLITLAIHPDLRRLGLATHFMTYLDQEAQNKNVTEISLDVRVSNFSAIQLYQKFCYQTVGRRKRYYADGEDAFVMVKTFQ